MSVSPFNTLSGAGAIERYKAKKKKEKKEKKSIVGISIEDMTSHSKKFRRPQLDRAVEILFENIVFAMLFDTPNIFIRYLIPPSLYPKSDKVP